MRRPTSSRVDRSASPPPCMMRRPSPTKGMSMKSLPILLGALGLADGRLRGRRSDRRTPGDHGRQRRSGRGSRRACSRTRSPTARWWRRLVIASLNATAHTFGDFFPEGSSIRREAAPPPTIWEDAAGFEAALAKFSADVAAAMQASGKDGPGRQGGLPGGDPARPRQLQDLPRDLPAQELSDAGARLASCS